MAHDSAGMVVKLVVSLVRHAPTCGMAHEVDGRAARSGIVRVVASRPQFRLCLVYLSFNTIQKMLPLDSTKKISSFLSSSSSSEQVRLFGLFLTLHVFQLSVSGYLLCISALCL